MATRRTRKDLRRMDLTRPSDPDCLPSQRGQAGDIEGRPGPSNDNDSKTKMPSRVEVVTFGGKGARQEWRLTPWRPHFLARVLVLNTGASADVRTPDPALW